MLSIGSVNAVFSDPSYESCQPSWVRRSLRYGLRRLVICPAGGFEEVDSGEEGGPADGLEAMEMDRFVPNDADGFTVNWSRFFFVAVFYVVGLHPLQSLLPGMDNTLGCYMKYHLVAEQPAETALAHGSSKMWFVLTYSSLVGYPHHTVCHPHVLPIHCLSLLFMGVNLPVVGLSRLMSRQMRHVGH